MALFSFSDIQFSSNRRQGVGPNNLLIDNPQQLKYNIYRYPEDVGNVDKGHYMVIHINTQRKSVLSPNDPVDELPTIYKNRIQSGYQSPFGAAVQSINEAFYDSSIMKGLSNLGVKITNTTSSALGSTTGKGPLEDFSRGFLRTVRRTSDTIAIYMPDTLGFQFNQNYSDLSLSESQLTGPVLAGASIVDLFKKGANFDEYVKNLSPFILPLFKDVLLKSSVSGFFGIVQNPMLEMIYSSPQFRTFRFDFMFYPRSSTEALQVQKILQKLTFHQAPEILRESKGYFLIPPSEFDIKFYYNGKENLNIPRISTCVLDGIDVDYAPNGFATYELSGAAGTSPSVGGTGMPVAIRMSLSFKETEYLTKSNFIEDSDLDSGRSLRAGVGVE